MDKLKEYTDRLKAWSPEADFALIYSGVVARSYRPALFMPSGLKLSAAFAALFVVIVAGVYFNSGQSAADDRSPMAYIFEKEYPAGNGALSYIFSD